MTDLDTWTDLDAACDDCRTRKEPAGWSPVWGMRLCFVCRAKRTEAEVKVVLAGGVTRDPPRETMMLL